jgi:hypothetical protein
VVSKAKGSVSNKAKPANPGAGVGVETEHKEEAKIESLVILPDSKPAPEVLKISSDGGYVQEFAACLFYHEHGTEKQFESLTPEEAKPYLEKGIAVMLHIIKMDRVLAPKVSMEETEARRRKDIDILTGLIEGFVKDLKTTKPALFPCGELAHRILDI